MIIIQEANFNAPKIHNALSWMQHVRITFCHNDEKQWFRLSTKVCCNMLQYRLHFIRNQNADLGFLNLLQIHEGLRLKLKVRTTYLFLVKGCLILEGVFTCVKSVRNHSPSTFQLRFIWTFSSIKQGS